MRNQWINIAHSWYGKERVCAYADSLLILYPVVVVKKVGMAKSHTIKDLVVRIPFGDHIWSRPRVIHGYRLTISALEYHRQFIHPHISSSAYIQANGIIKESRFCTGSSALNTFTLEENTCTDTIERYFAMLDQFVSQESTDGSAYMHIYGLGTTLYSDIENFPPFTQPIDQVVQKVLCKNKDKFHISIDSSTIEVAIQHDLDLEGIEGITMCYRRYNGVEYIDGNNPLQIPSSLNLKTDYPFNGRTTVVVELPPESNKKEKDDRVLYIPRKALQIIQNYGQTYITNKIRKSLYAAEKARWDSLPPNSRERGIADKVSV